VWTSGIPPFQEAWDGLRAGLNSTESIVSIDLKSPSAKTELERAAQHPQRLVVAIGVSALTAVRKHRFSAPTLATMVLHSDAVSALPAVPGQKLVTVYLDIPIADVIARLRASFPGKTRLGIIRNPSWDSRVDPQWPAEARRQGFTIEVRECASPETLLKTFLTLKHKADFVLLQPDATLYNEATARPLLLASLENQLPVIGFSASFVRSGAAVGVYPDFADIGEQTAELARRFLAAGASPASESPRKLIFSTNYSVLRLLGLDPKSAAEYPMTLIK
jgi:ABC-type uncharacterized transport system substrate-binding protein